MSSDEKEYADAEAMRRPAGHILLDGVQVADTAQCVHCGSHFVMRRGSGVERGFCTRCNGLVCGRKCAVCIPFEKRLDLAEKAGSR